MTRWDYKTVTLAPGSAGFHPLPLPVCELQTLGQEGWELVTVITAGGLLGYIFKRPLGSRRAQSFG